MIANKTFFSSARRFSASPNIAVSDLNTKLTLLKQEYEDFSGNHEEIMDSPIQLKVEKKPPLQNVGTRGKVHTSLYIEAEERMRRKGIVQKHYKEEILRQAEKSKANLKSTIISKKKLARDLNTVLDRVSEGLGQLNFDSLGVFLKLIGVYRILYNPQFHIKCSPEGELVLTETGTRCKEFYERKNQELQLQLKLWQTLQAGDQIDTAVLLEFLLLLSDPSFNSVDELAQYTQELLNATKLEGETNEGSLENCKKLVFSFKKLNVLPIILPTQLLKENRSTKPTFHPSICPKSRKIAGKSQHSFQQDSFSQNYIYIN